MNKGKKKEQAITLIALVVTIVVLLILAGVSIAMLTGENGIITQAKNAKEQNEKGEIEEKVRLAVMSAKTAGKGKIDFDELNSELDKIGYEGTDITSLPADVTIDRVKVTIKENGGVTGEDGVIEPVAKTITLKFEMDGSMVEIGTFEVEEGETIAEVIERIKNFNGYIIEVNDSYTRVTLPSGYKKYCGIYCISDNEEIFDVLGLPCIQGGEYILSVLPG